MFLVRGLGAIRVLPQGIQSPDDAMIPCSLFAGDEATVDAKYPGSKIWGAMPAGSGGDIPRIPGIELKPGMAWVKVREGLFKEGRLAYGPNFFEMVGSHGPLVAACPPDYVHNCLEATYNRDRGEWDCNSYGERCNLPPYYGACEPVRSDRLYVTVDDPDDPDMTGYRRVRALSTGEPDWATEVEEEGSTGTAAAIATSGLPSWLGTGGLIAAAVVGVIGLIFLLRR